MVADAESPAQESPHGSCYQSDEDMNMFDVYCSDQDWTSDASQCADSDLDEDAVDKRLYQPVQYFQELESLALRVVHNSQLSLYKVHIQTHVSHSSKGTKLGRMTLSANLSIKRVDSKYNIPTMAHSARRRL